MAIHSHILAWRIPRTEEPSKLWSMRVTESDMTEQLTQHTHTHTHTHTHAHTHTRIHINIYIGRWVFIFNNTLTHEVTFLSKKYLSLHSYKNYGSNLVFQIFFTIWFVKCVWAMIFFFFILWIDCNSTLIWVSLFVCFNLRGAFFKCSFRSLTELGGTYREHILSYPHTYTDSPLSAFGTKPILLLELVNPY